jgi:hypothetical protein
MVRTSILDAEWREPVNSTKLIIVGVVWLGLVILWVLFAPREFGINFGPIFGFRRALIKIAIYGVGLLYSVFIFGWLVPLSVGIYHALKSR